MRARALHTPTRCRPSSTLSSRTPCARGSTDTLPAAALPPPVHIIELVTCSAPCGAAASSASSASSVRPAARQRAAGRCSVRCSVRPEWMQRAVPGIVFASPRANWFFFISPTVRGRRIWHSFVEEVERSAAVSVEPHRAATQQDEGAPDARCVLWWQARTSRAACAARAARGGGVPGGLLACWGPRQLAVALLRREAAARQGGAGCAVPGAACFTTRRSCAARASAAFAPPGGERCPGVAAAAGPGPGGWGGARGAAQADSRGSVGAVWVCP